MIDHETARRSFSTSLDFPLEPDERDALDGHLRECPACRAFSTSMRGDAALLRDLDLGPVPIAVRANVAIAAERDGRGGAVSRWTLLAATGALLLVVLGGGALGVGGGRQGQGQGQGQASGDPGSSFDPDATSQISWKTEVVGLQAREFAILAGGRTFRAATPPVSVSSDPGDATYRTLEATWRENGVEMRLNLYFGGDATASWVDGVRIYNGAPNGSWLYAKGMFFKTPIGVAWTGDADITMVDADHVGGTPAVVHFGGLSLANRPFDGVKVPQGDGISLPAKARPFAPGGVLRCSGILQMTPREAADALLKMGYKVSWRYVTQNGGSWEPRADAPDGVIPDYDISVGPSGELIIPVITFGEKDAVPAPFPADCPQSDPKLTPPPIAP